MKITLTTQQILPHVIRLKALLLQCISFIQGKSNYNHAISISFWHSSRSHELLIFTEISIIMKFKFILFLSLLVSIQSLSARQLFLAENGKDSNNGTIDEPWGSLKYAFSKLGAGDTLWIRSGTYMQTERIYAKACGTKDDRICVFAYDKEKPILNWSNAPQSLDNDGRGIEHSIGANYWHYRGLEICYCGDNGMKLEGSFCVIEECTFHHNRDTGLQLGFGKGNNDENTRNPDFIYGRYNIIINCDSHHNYDLAPDKTSGGGGNADGFAVKLFPGPGNEFHGCRAWMNSDDGWDFFFVKFPIVVHNCWAMKNGYDKGNRNGFKMGGFGSDASKASIGAHVFSNCIVTDHEKKGFDQNSHNEGSYLFNCIAARNGANYQFDSNKGGDLQAGSKWILRNCVGSQAIERNHKFFSEETCDISHCSWNFFDNNNTYTDSNKRIKTDYSGEYESLAYEDGIAPRQKDGSLPLKFGRLKSDSRFLDKGTPIVDFDCINYSDNHYSTQTSISYNGTAPDLGAFEYGSPNNLDYHFQYPVNDGSIEDPEPTDPYKDFRDENGVIAYKENILANWYPFQDAVLPPALSSVISLNKGTAESNIAINTEYTGSSESSHPAYTQTQGAVIMPKGGSYIQFTLPSIHSLQLRMYNTGGRDVKIQYGSPTEPESSWKVIEKTGYSKGNFTIDVTSLAQDIKRKTPITIRVYNHKTSGNIQVTDAYISIYEKLSTNIESTFLNDINMYQTSTSLIVYGENSSIDIYDTNGRVVTQSRSSQVVDISMLPRSMYILVITRKDGTVNSTKLIKR